MNSPRENISANLFAVLKGAYTWVTSSRAAVVWSNLDHSQQPAMFLIHIAESANQNQALGLPKWILHYHCLIYAKVDTSTGADPPDKLINTIIDAVENGLHPQPGEKQTLSGLVTDAFIQGDIMIDTGIFDQQIAVVIPIRVLTGI